MDLKAEFIATLRRLGWKPEHKVLVAVSGGMDSMTLAALCADSGLQMAVAHCNFQLRGEDSQADEQLVRDWCAGREVRLHTRRFDTRAFMQTAGLPVQLAARKLRYDWFDALRASEAYDALFTAHHLQDNIETLLMNFFNGTGMQGMQGMPESAGYIRRPLLGTDRAALRSYAEQQAVPWREDASNAGDDYLRNRIRHKLWPVLESLFPDPLQTLSGNIRRMKESALLYQEALHRHKRRLLEKRGQDWVIPVLKMRTSPAPGTLFYELLKPFGFQSAQVPDLLQLLDAESGKQVLSKDYRILKNRNLLVVTALQPIESEWISLERPENMYRVEYGKQGAYLELERIRTDLKSPDAILRKYGASDTLCLDSSLLHYPLLFRPWKQGDYFYPLGLGGKKKKVSRFLIDQKMGLHEKERVWVLMSAERLVALPGLRIDERFKLRPNTREVLRIRHFAPQI